jgi:hypothetical protein
MIRSEELRELLRSPNFIKIVRSGRLRWAWHVAKMEDKSNAYRILVGKPL